MRWDPSPPQPGDDVEHAHDERDEQHRDGHLREPAPQHLPGEKQRGLASALDGDGGVELGDDVGRRGPCARELGGIEVGQAEVVSGGARRDRYGRDVTGDQRALLLVRIRDGVAGELVVEPRCPRRHPVEGLEAVADDRVDRRRRALGSVGTHDDPERRPVRSCHVVEHDRGDDPRPQLPRRAEGGRALGPGGPPSVETSTSPRSGGMSASVRASWTRRPVPAASPPVEPSRWAMTAMICRERPGR